MIYPNGKADLNGCEGYVCRSAAGTSLEFVDSQLSDSNLVSIVCDGGVVYLPMNELIDIEKEWLE